MRSLLFSACIILLGAFGCTQTTSDPSSSTASGENQEGQQIIELRTYSVSSDAQANLVHNYLKNAAIPALNRAGVSPVGVFVTPDTLDNQQISVLLPYNSLEAFGEIRTALANDAEHQSAGKAYLEIQHPNKPYDRIESFLMRAFEEQKTVVSTPLTEGNQDRVFELRSYESADEAKGDKKVQMFDAGGEVRIFQELGFMPVFFGQALTGDQMPNLVYMVTYDSMDSRGGKWKEFGSDPGWVAIKDLPEYANTVSKIHSTFWLPADYSQI